jgi:hypothetical protein
VGEPGAHASRPRTPDAFGLIARLESPRWQAAGLALAMLLVAVPHWANDGLWYQGDAPRHAINGLFFWDLLTTLPLDPLGYALSYYARYPVLAPVAYPPLFYIIEGLGFALTTPSPLVAKTLVLASLALLGAYTLRWGRTRISPIAGWAGAVVVLLPGFVRYSNAVLLNVPSTALGVAALYHLLQWMDGGDRAQGGWFTALTVAAVFTYYPGGIVLPIAIVWILGSARLTHSWTLWLVPVILFAVGVATMILLPVHFARHAPSLGRLFNPRNWEFYGREIAAMIGAPWLFLSVLGLAAGLTSARRKEALRLALAIPTVLLCLLVLPAMTDRYALILGPIAVLSMFLAITTIVSRAGALQPLVATVAVVAVLAFGSRAALAVTVQEVSGIRAVTDYLREHAATDTVMYSGRYDGVFGFYLRAGDPYFERRMVLASKLLFRYEQDQWFNWIETPHAKNVAEVVSLIEQRSGARWVAVEIGDIDLNVSELRLREALHRPGFEHVRTFPVRGRRITHIDLYRVTLPLAPAPPIDLMFPSFDDDVYRGVTPLASRR